MLRMGNSEVRVHARCSELGDCGPMGACQDSEFAIGAMAFVDTAGSEQ